MIKININKLNENAIIPYCATKCSAGYDLYACTSTPVVIAPHETVKISTGLAMQLPHGYFGAIFARSGLSTKQGLRPATCVSVIDEDYTGEWIIPLHNDSNESQIINPMERIAQTVIMPYLPVEFNEVDELSETERGEGGFGSTGK